MPDAKDNAKLTGDTHLPDLESEADENAPAAEYQRSGTAQNKGGEIKDKEAPTSDSYGTTRDSGERPK